MTERWKVPAFDIRVSETRSSLLRVSMQMWEVESGELIWSSVAETVMESETVTQDPVFLEDAIRLTFGSIMTDFLNRRTGSKYTPLNEVLNTLVQTPIPEEQPNANTGEAEKKK
jgi:NurA-like 5'-3' nuclease